MKPDFDNAEYLARELRLIQNNDSLSLDVRKMNFDKPIIIDTFQNYSKLTNIPLEKITAKGKLKDGYTIITDNVYIILYNIESLYSERLNWTLAHEVGHIYLGHTKDKQKEEIEAHWFAAELLAPETIIKSLAKLRNQFEKKVNVLDLQDMFHISYEASEKRIESLNRKCMWNIYLENEIINKYQKQIMSMV